MSAFLAENSKKRLLRILAAIGVGALSITSVHAVPMIFGSNAYEFVLVSDPYTGSNNSWSSARTAAAASVFAGVNGHLATVTSQAENDFLVSLLGTYNGFNGAWLGGDFLNWLEGPEGGKNFAQVGGYKNWNALEPNNAGLMYMSIGDSTPNTGNAGLGSWLDDSGVNGLPDPVSDPVIGYFVEYEQVVSAVPEPASTALLGFGLLVLGYARKKLR